MPSESLGCELNDGVDSRTAFFGLSDFDCVDRAWASESFEEVFDFLCAHAVRETKHLNRFPHSRVKPNNNNK